LPHKGFSGQNNYFTILLQLLKLQQ